MSTPLPCCNPEGFDDKNNHVFLCSRSPNILAHTLDPIPQLVHARIPILQPQPHAVDLLHVQHLGLHPIDARNLGHLVDAPPQQAQAQRFHDQDLNLLRVDVGLGRDGGEGHGAVVRRAAEDGFRQGGQADLLPQERLALVQERGFREVVLEHGVRRQIAAVEREEEVPQPGVLGGFEGVEDRV